MFCKSEGPQLMLIVRDLVKNFSRGENQAPVLNKISIMFKQGESYAVTGVSGSGKSTFLQLLAGLDLPTTGTVLLDEQPIYTIRQKSCIISTKIGMMFQFHYLIKELTVLENAMLPGLIIKAPAETVIKNAKNLLEMVGLSAKINSYPPQLSGGEQQRVSLVRALLNRPTFLLADEPTGNLDAENAQLVTNLLVQAQTEWHMGLIICSHDKSVYQRMQHIYRLHQGVLNIESES